MLQGMVVEIVGVGGDYCRVSGAALAGEEGHGMCPRHLVARELATQSRDWGLTCFQLAYGPSGH